MKKTLRLAGIFLLLIYTNSCNKKDVECNERSLRSISFGFESSLEDWINLRGNIEAKNSSDIEVSSDTAKEGSKAVKFSVSPDSYINGGNRAELTFDQMIESGDETFYEYSLLILEDYQDVESLKADDGKPNWQILGQWHDQPDECAGDTWEDIEGNSPPIAVYYNYFTKSDNEYVNLLSDPEFVSKYGLDTSWDSVSTIALEYSGSVIAIDKVEKGKWIDLKFNIKWSKKMMGLFKHGLIIMPLQMVK